MAVSTEKQIPPLTLEDSVSQSQCACYRRYVKAGGKKTIWSRFLRRMTCSYPEMERHWIDLQMESRTEITLHLWEESNPSVVEFLFEILEANMAYPNHNFIPEDPVRLLILEDNYGLGFDCVISDIHNKFEISEKAVHHWFETHQDAKLLELVSYLEGLQTRRSG